MCKSLYVPANRFILVSGGGQDCTIIQTHHDQQEGPVSGQSTQVFQREMNAAQLDEHSRLWRKLDMKGEDKPYLCLVCGFRGNWPSHMVRHLLVHTGSKPFKCAKCPKRFGRRHHLKSHEVNCGVPKHMRIKPPAVTDIPNLSQLTASNLQSSKQNSVSFPSDEDGFTMPGSNSINGSMPVITTPATIDFLSELKTNDPNPSGQSQTPSKVEVINVENN